jgi:hypothetical protein
MSDATRRFRGPAIALVVLALSAGAVFAGSAGSTALPTRVASDTPLAAEKTASDEATEEPTETPESQTPDAAGASADSAPQDTHGALVSKAAQMVTPAAFANHGAFVSCVAHMKDATVTFDLTTLTPASCAAAKASGKANANADAGKAKGQAGRAQGAANRAAAATHH